MSIREWEQHLTWSQSWLLLIVTIILIALICSGWRNLRRYQRAKDLFIPHGSIDQARTNGQFYTPRPMRDQKGVTR